jgi:outer membrane receptor protein involved in Fe transport
VAALDPIVDTEGREIGIRSGFFNNMQISVAYFEIDLGSELVFVGDNGSVEPRGASERKGIEVGVFYQPREWLTIDGDYAHTTARFKEDPGGIGNIVPDSMEDVFSLSLAIDTDENWFGGARARYFGPRALLEDNSLRSDSTFTINANAGYRFTEKMSFRAEVINIFDAENDDITYWFESRTADELAAGLDPIEDLHFHPVEPRMFRLTLEYRL